MKRKIVEVTWRDAFTHREPSKRPSLPQRSVGYLIRQTKTHVTIAQTVEDDGPKDFLTIPRRWHVRVRKLHR